MQRIGGTALIVTGLLAAAAPAMAAGFSNYVDLQLVLAVDVSRSMDYNEQRVQRDGYVAAFKSPEVQKAIASGPYGRIAITYVEWSSAFYQRVLVPWQVIASNSFDHYREHMSPVSAWLALQG